MLFSHSVSMSLTLCGLRSVHILMATGFYGTSSVKDFDPRAEFQSGRIISADHRNMLKLDGFNATIPKEKRCFENWRARLGNRGN